MEKNEKKEVFCGMCGGEMTKIDNALVKGKLLEWWGCEKCDKVEIVRFQNIEEGWQIEERRMLDYTLSWYQEKYLKKVENRAPLFGQWRKKNQQSVANGQISLSVSSPRGVDAQDDPELVWIEGLSGQPVKVLCRYCKTVVASGSRALGVIVYGSLMLVSIRKSTEEECPNCFGRQMVPDFTVSDGAAEAADALIKGFGITVYPCLFADYQITAV